MEMVVATGMEVRRMGREAGMEGGGMQMGEEVGKGVGVEKGLGMEMSCRWGGERDLKRFIIKEWAGRYGRYGEVSQVQAEDPGKPVVCIPLQEQEISQLNARKEFSLPAPFVLFGPWWLGQSPLTPQRTVCFISPWIPTLAPSRNTLADTLRNPI